MSERVGEWVVRRRSSEGETATTDKKLHKKKLPFLVCAVKRLCSLAARLLRPELEGQAGQAA